MAGPVIRARNRACDILRFACNFLFTTCNILSVEYFWWFYLLCPEKYHKLPRYLDPLAAVKHFTQTKVQTVILMQTTQKFI
jgi:hypothetical protein